MTIINEDEKIHCFQKLKIKELKVIPKVKPIVIQSPSTLRSRDRLNAFIFKAVIIL